MPEDAPTPPARAGGVELLGAMAGSGYREPPLLVRRADGQTVQLTPLLYSVLKAMDGERSHRHIAWQVATDTGKLLSRAEVAYLVNDKLRPLGLVKDGDGRDPNVTRLNPLLALRLRVVITNTRITNLVTAPFAPLFHPAVIVPMLVAFSAITGWLLFDNGLGAALRQSLYEPKFLLLLFGLTVLSAGFHEFGHAAACRYGGATPRAMGAALYLVWPVFYTDVTDSYALERRARLRVDLGGLYFNAIFAVMTFGVWAVVRSDALLVMVPVQLFQMLRQLLPVLRCDGYHILADLTGVPDLFARIRPTLRAMIPWRRPEAATELKRWVRVTVTTWVLVVVPVLAASLVWLLVVLPRIAATAWDSAQLQLTVLRQNIEDGDAASVAVRVISLLLVAIPPLSMSYLVARIGRRSTLRVWRATEGHVAPRGLLLLGGACASVMAISALWPDGQYAPIEPGERAALGDGFGARPHGGLVAHHRGSPEPMTAPSGSSSPARRARVTAKASPIDDAPAPVAAGDPRPTTRSLALIEADPSPPTAANRDLSGWPFPFAPPPLPRRHDTFAVAVNATDGAAVTDMQASLQWVTAGSVDHRNRSYAMATCTDCRTTAAAFQVVVASGSPRSVVPENTAVAVNHACERCSTHAFAVQLVVTLDEPPTSALRAEVAHHWRSVRRLDASAHFLSAEDLHTRMLALRAEFLRILRPDAVTTISRAEADTATPTTATPAETEGTPTSSTTTTTTTPSSSPSPTASTSTSSSSTSTSSTTSSSTTTSSTTSSTTTTTSSTSASSSTTSSTSTTSTTSPPP